MDTITRLSTASLRERVYQTLQTAIVVELNATGKPDDAVAETVKGAVPKVLFTSALNVMVWLFLTVNDWMTCAAAV